MAETTLRLFFALWPDSATRARLQRAGAALQKSWGGRPTRAENLHATLVFLGDTPAGALDALLALGAAQAALRSVLRLTHTDCWQRSGVGVLCPDAVEATLLQLVERLQRGLGEAGLRFDRRAWRPHVTLLRHVRCGAEAVAVPPVEWRVEGFVLLAARHESAGVRYEVLGHWGGAV